MPSTHEIIEAQAHLQAMVEALLYAEGDAERDAIQAEIDTWLEALGDAEPEKLDALRHVHRRLSTLEEEARAEARRLGERARSIASQAERVKGLTAVILDGRRRRGAEAKVTTATATYRLQLGPASVVGPEDVAVETTVPGVLPSPLLRVRIAVRAGQRLYQRGLAVVHVAGCAHDKVFHCSTSLLSSAQIARAM